MTESQIALIAVMARNRVIGKDNAMPWHHRADLKHFKNMTMGKPIVMGRKTLQSIGKALPGRHNIVITGNKEFEEETVSVVHTLQDALALAEKDNQEIMIIGGAKLYEQCLDIANTLYLTIIDHDYPGDTYFPQFSSQGWQETDREDHPADESHPYNYSFVTLKRA